MKRPRFRYALDPLCLLACWSYGINEAWIKPATALPFFHGQFNDFWLIPAALPPVLWLQRRLGLRADDAFPRLPEIALHLGIWAALFEGIGPRLLAVTGDPWDVVAYVCGAALSWAVWRWRGRRQPALPAPAASEPAPWSVVRS